MEDYKSLYNTIKAEYETYQKFSENYIQELNIKNMKLERNIDSLYNIVEISKYINTHFSDDNLICMINDMILGILGVTYSTIFLIEDNKLRIKTSNVENMNIIITENEMNYIIKGNEFLINSKKSIKQCGKNKEDIHSVMGVPINLKEKFIGYIMVEHKIYNFMTIELKVFLKSIANQIAIPLENSILYKKLEKLTRMDSLLKIYNRKYFFECLEKIKKEKAIKRFAIVMADVDDFKKVNDTFGHQIGDEVLINTVNVICRHLEEDDVVARYGGEELILYIPNFKCEKEVEDKVEIIRKSLEKSKINVNGKCYKITASFGISFFPNDGENINNLIKCADDLLYKSKKSGKNRILSTYNEKNKKNY